MAINKTGFADKMAKRGGITKAEANRQIDLFVETLLGCLGEDGEVKLHGFGKFELKTVKEKIARNLRTGEACIAPEHKKVKFYASEALSRRVEEMEDQD